MRFVSFENTSKARNPSGFTSIFRKIVALAYLDEMTKASTVATNPELVTYSSFSNYPNGPVDPIFDFKISS